MKLLIDENLSRKLVARLSELYPGSAHVAEFDLLKRPDREIWSFAKTGDFTMSPQGDLVPALVTPDAGC